MKYGIFMVDDFVKEIDNCPFGHLLYGASEGA